MIIFTSKLDIIHWTNLLQYGGKDQLSSNRNIKNRTLLLTNYALIHRCFSVYAMRIINLVSRTRKTID